MRSTTKQSRWSRLDVFFSFFEVCHFFLWQQETTQADEKSNLHEQQRRRCSCSFFHPGGKKINKSDGWKGKIFRLELLGLRWCSRRRAHIPPRRSQGVGCGSLSTRRQTAVAILDLLTKPGCTNTELITPTHICSNVHARGLSGQGLAAGNDCFVCVCECMCVIGSD